uniref:Uncharacterized protein n=1 Tax=viral metagenome TaxID=1070528 RepID=A0A6M3J2P5_9ZZZZ
MDHEQSLAAELKVIRLLRGNLAKLPSAKDQRRVLEYLLSRLADATEEKAVG